MGTTAHASTPPAHQQLPTFVVFQEAHLQHAYALLQAAMQAGGMQANLVPAPQSNEVRSLYQIQRGFTHVDMVPASPQRLQLLKEGKLRMIPVPLDRGLLGWRVNLLLQSKAEQLRDVRDKNALAKFTLGQHAGWTDIEIYQHAGLPVKPIKRWSHGEFAEQMQAGFIDLFPLGIEEAVTYFLPHFQKRYPQLTMDQHVLVRYPWYRFVWVSAAPSADPLYEALVNGFERIVQSGEFLRIWNAYRQVPPAHLYQNRAIIDIPNPFFDIATIPEHYRKLLLLPHLP